MNLRPFCLGLALAVVTVISTETTMSQDTSPISTQWLLDAVGASGKAAVSAVYMIVSPQTASKGTGFLLESGVIITNEHVVRGAGVKDLYGISSSGSKISFKNCITDTNRDLAALLTDQSLRGGLRLGDDKGILAGQLVWTWGFPLGYNGPSPLLSVGYLSGFIARSTPNPKLFIKHMIVNAAFNSGNSGGPVFLQNSDEVIGVVVNKALPLFTPYVQSAISVFSQNQSGVVFSKTDDKGQTVNMVESQVVAEMIKSLRDMSQVMIGEAVSVAELKAFLTENNL